MHKNVTKAADPESKVDIEEAENLAAFVGAMIERRNVLGISQRELAISVLKQTGR